MSELQEIVFDMQPEEGRPEVRSKSSDFRKFPNIKDKRKVKPVKVSPYKRKFVVSRPKTSLEVRNEVQNKRNKARIYSVDYSNRSKTPVEGF